MNGETTWKELVSQPDAWETLIGRLDREAVALPVSLADFDEVTLIGSGTSYYLALAAADWIRRRHPVLVRAVPSCEVILDPAETERPGRRLAIGFSRSGRSSELLLAVAALRRRGVTTVGVSCSEGAPSLAECDHALLIGEGHEDGLVMLRSFTSMLVAAQHLFGSDADRVALRRLPDAGWALIADHGMAVRALAERRGFDRFVFLGSGSDHPLALEAALKVQEMAIATSEAYHTLEYRHGPKACAGPDTAVTLFALPPEHGLPLAHELKALGTTVMVLGPGADAYSGIADFMLATPVGLGADQAAPLTLMPVHLFAFATAMHRGHDPDNPVNLSKVVTF